MAAHQAPLSLGFSRLEHWSGLPLPSPMHESEKWKWSHSAMPESYRLHGLQPTRLLHRWDFPGKSTGVGCHCLLHLVAYPPLDSGKVTNNDSFILLTNDWLVLSRACKPVLQKEFGVFWKKRASLPIKEKAHHWALTCLQVVSEAMAAIIHPWGETSAKKMDSPRACDSKVQPILKTLDLNLPGEILWLLSFNPFLDWFICCIYKHPTHLNYPKLKTLVPLAPLNNTERW